MLVAVVPPLLRSVSSLFRAAADGCATSSKDAPTDPLAVEAIAEDERVWSR